MTLEQKIALLAETIETDSKNLILARSLDSLDEWDSLALISLIGMFSKSFGRNIPVETLKEFKTVQDIVNEMHE
ncbi:MAG TPA: hypothetical protein DEP01_07580 [Aminobacterium sp.]|jgi:acyl carrier protein|uniref:acyl carrier protein n=1 Tax=Aminobacterium TaxID=81466 RepID=UPI000EC7DCD1|nr:acyl carrier protein [Aminobacterium sp. UBA4834]HCA41338.1 hypothetical protein [Aminobacterium sp.]